MSHEELTGVNNQDLKQMYSSYYAPLFHLAYHMLGSTAEAEDAVHDVFMTLNRDESRITLQDSWKSYLWKMTTNRCIDILKSARVKREQYTGPWLPEPLNEDSKLDQSESPLQRVVLREQLSYSLLVLMDRLTPYERCVFLLKEVYGYTYNEVANITNKTEANCRQLLSRAKKKLNLRQEHVDTENIEVTTTGKEQKQWIHQFFSAIEKNDIEALKRICMEDIKLYADGGGKVPAATRPVEGLERVSILLLAVANKQLHAFETEIRTINGQQGLVLKNQEKTVTHVICFDVFEQKLQTIYVQMNPQKLKNFNR